MFVEVQKSRGEFAAIVDKRFLVSDENDLDRRLVSDILYDAGALEVIETSNGQDAMRALMDGATDVDLVFLDIHMPRMDGLTLLEKIRNGAVDRRYRDTPLIMLTDLAGMHYREAARVRAANGFLTKPVMADALVKAVVSNLGC